MEAKEMFKELGYKRKITRTPKVLANITYTHETDYNTFITFDLNDINVKKEIFYIEGHIISRFHKAGLNEVTPTHKESKAIHKQMIELGWLDE